MEIQITSSDERRWDKKWRAVCGNHKMYASAEHEITGLVELYKQASQTEAPAALLEHAQSEGQEYFVDLGSYDEDEEFDCSASILEKASAMAGIVLSEDQEVEYVGDISDLLGSSDMNKDENRLWMMEYCSRLAWSIVSGLKTDVEVEEV